jgi:uncharacterized protein
MQRIPRAVTERLGHYVYGYVSPRSGQITYVGKGQGQRALAHLLRLRGQRVDILAHGLPDEATAFAVEAAVIDALGLHRLTNRVRGQGSSRFGRVPLSDLVIRYRARPIDIREPSVLIRITQLFRPGMSASELYEVTRGVWVIGKRRETLKYAMAVHSCHRPGYVTAVSSPKLTAASSAKVTAPRSAKLTTASSAKLTT